jgi:hypothetical protein
MYLLFTLSLAQAWQTLSLFKGLEDDGKEFKGLKNQDMH